MSYMSLVGTRQVIETLKNLGRIPGHNVRLYLVIPTLYSARARQDREVIALLRRYFADRVTKPIRMSTKLAEAPSHHQTIYEYSPRSRAAADYKRLVDRILRNG